MQEHGVTYRLKIEADERNDAVLADRVNKAKAADDAVANSAKGARARVGNEAKRGADEATGAARRSADDQKRIADEAANYEIGALKRRREEARKAGEDERAGHQATATSVINAAGVSRRAFTQGIAAAKGLTTQLRAAGGDGADALQKVSEGLEGLGVGIAAFDASISVVELFRGLLEASASATDKNAAATKKAAVENVAAYEAEIAALKRLNEQKNPGSHSGPTVPSSFKASAGGGLGAGAKAGLAGVAIGAAVAAITVVAEHFTGLASKTGSLTDRIAKAEVAVAGFFINKLPEGLQKLLAKWGPGFIGDTARAIVGGKELEAAKGRRDAALAQDERKNWIEGQQARLSLFNRDRDERRLDYERSMTESPEAQRAIIVESMMRLNADIGRAGADRDRAVGSDAQKQYEDEILRLAQRRTELAREHAEIERRVLDEQKRGAEEQIKAAQEQVKASREVAKAEADRLRSGAERFAAMDPLKQAKAIAAVRFARAGGEISDDQRSLLRSIGTREATRFAQQADIREAQRAGFFQFFGAEERAIAGREAQRQQALSLQIEDKRTIVANLQANTSEIVRETVAEITEYQDREMEKVLATLRREVAAEQRKAALARNDELLQRRQNAGGR